MIHTAQLPAGLFICAPGPEYCADPGSQQEIAEAVEVTRQAIAVWEDEFTEKLTSDNSVNWHDFEPPIYKVWRKGKKSDGVEHFGQSEIGWVENLLYLYTNPVDIVVDPFAGSGSTINVCKKRNLRYWVSDRKPIVEREHEIRKHDLVGESGIQLPAIPRWKDVKLVYLDPPYWKQAESQYSHAPTDLVNMPLEQFNETLAGMLYARRDCSSGRYGPLSDKQKGR